MSKSGRIEMDEIKSRNTCNLVVVTCVGVNSIFFVNDRLYKYENQKTTLRGRVLITWPSPHKVFRPQFSDQLILPYILRLLPFPLLLYTYPSLSPVVHFLLMV